MDKLICNDSIEI